VRARARRFPFGGLCKSSGGVPPVTRRAHASRGVALLCRVHPTVLAAPLGSAAPLMSSATSAGLQGVRTAGCLASPESKARRPLMSLRSPSECSARRAAVAPNCSRSRSRDCRLLPWGCFPYSVSPPKAAARIGRASRARPALRLQVFATSWRLRPPRACWPCFMPDPLLGFSLQSFAPLVQPRAVSSAVALLSLERVADPSEPPASSRMRRSAASRYRLPNWPDRRSVPRLQGFAPHESPPPHGG
jgi:hypothetical protein